MNQTTKTQIEVNRQILSEVASLPFHKDRIAQYKADKAEVCRRHGVKVEDWQRWFVTVS